MAIVVAWFFGATRCGTNPRCQIELKIDRASLFGCLSVNVGLVSCNGMKKQWSNGHDVNEGNEFFTF